MNIGSIIILLIVFVIIVTLLLFLLPGLTGAPYVPTPKDDIEKALTELHKIKSNDLLIDLGAGDGVVLYTATRHGARALGLEINPILALCAKFRFRKNRKITIKCRNFYHYSFPKNTTVVYAYAISQHMRKIQHKIEREAQKLGKPIYFISNAFDLKDLKPKKKVGPFYLYIITNQKR